MTQHFVATKIHGITATHLPMTRELVGAFHKEAHIMVGLVERAIICSPSLLISAQETIVETLGRRAINAKMVGDETIVAYIEHAILIIYRRTIERIAYHLPPMLPSRIDAMVVVVVHASEMVRNIHRMVVIVRTALVLSIEIFEDDVTQPSAIFQV